MSSIASEINCLKPCVVVKESIMVPLILVMSFDHHVDDLALKSTKIKERKKERFKFNTALTRRPIHYSNISFFVLNCYLTN